MVKSVGYDLVRNPRYGVCMGYDSVNCRDHLAALQRYAPPRPQTPIMLTQSEKQPRYEWANLAVS